MIFYALSVIVAFIVGGYFERIKTPPPSGAVVTATSATTSAPPAAENTPAAPVVAEQQITEPSATPALITVPSATPMRIEKAVAVSKPSVSAAPAASAAPVAKPSPDVAQVTVVKAIEIPVEKEGKIVGYINLQAGQKITPAGVEKDQIKVKTGENYVYVPVKATDMAH